MLGLHSTAVDNTQWWPAQVLSLLRAYWGGALRPTPSVTARPLVNLATFLAETLNGSGGVARGGLLIE